MTKSNQANENRYQALFLASRDAIMTLEPPTWKFTSGNPATFKMFDVKNEKEFLTHEPWEFSPKTQPDKKDSQQKAKEMISIAMNKGHNFFEWTHRRINGQDFLTEVLLSRVDNNGKPFLHAVIRDITQRKQIEKKEISYEKEKFKIVFDNASDGLALVNTSSKKFSLTNKTFCKMLGYSLAEIKKLTISNIHPKENLPYILEQFKKQKQGEINLIENIPVKRKNGSIFYTDINATPITINNESLVFGSYRDTTQRKKEEEALRQIELIVQNSHDAIIGETLDSIITSWNSGATKMFGYTFSEMVGKPMSDLSPPELKDESPKLLEKIKNGKVIADYDSIWLRKDDTRADVEFSASPVYSETGAIISVSLVGRDITERKKNEARIIELSDIRSKFLDIIAHQLRTPIGALNWNLESILNGDFGKLEETQYKFLQATHKSSLKITSRIHDLITAMDIEEGRILFEKKEVALNNLVWSVINEITERSKLKNITCQYISPDKELIIFEGDSEKIRTIITNLIENALIYTPENGQITAKLEAIGDTIRFEVKDTGIGIPAPEQHRVFTRFFRASNASVMQPDAFGLGLFTAKSFIENHGGKIGFESTEGKGSNFWFELPVRINKK